MNTTEPLPALLEAYFADLNRALLGSDPREHAETVQAMREHAAEIVSRDGASEQTARQVIADFGPVEQVAAAASSAPGSSAPAPERSWTDIWLLAGSIAGFALYVFPFIAVAMLVWAVVRIRGNTGNRRLQRAALWVSLAAVVFSVGLFTLRLVNGLWF